MTDLLDVDSAAKRSLLCVVSRKSYAMLCVSDAVGGDWRVVADKMSALTRCEFHSTIDAPDLLTDELCLASCILPLAQEEFSKEWVQWLLLTSKLLISAAVLLLQGAEEPL